MASIFVDRHVLDGLAGQKFESTWGEGRLSNGRGWWVQFQGFTTKDTKVHEGEANGVFVVHVFLLFCVRRSFRHNGRRSAHVTDSAVDIQGRHLKLTNLEKVLYPATGFTKQQVIDYYARIAPAIIPHLAGRALTRKRYPDGVDGEPFF